MKIWHFLHFAVLLFIIFGGVGAFFYAEGSSSLQLTIGVLTAFAYMIWGIWHHAMQKDLYLKLVIEYILIAAIAVVLLATMSL